MRRRQGFTLVELIVVMVIIGILAGTITAYFGPAIQSYLDVKRRANLTDMADGAVRAMMRDIRSAVGNSIRTGGDLCFEVVPTASGGRYRTAPNTTWDAAHPTNTTKWVNTLEATTEFDVMTPLATAPTVGDYVVINNQSVDDVYATTNSPSRATISKVTPLNAADNIGTYRLQISSLQIAPAYDNARFVVVPAAQQAVFYVCSDTGVNASTGNGKGTLYRFSAYGFNTNATSCPAPTASTPVVATKVSSCLFTYEPNSGGTMNAGYMQLRLTLTENNQSVRLVVGTHTDNTP